LLANLLRIRYDASMKDAITDPSQLSWAEAIHLQALEGNPLDAADLAMFEMFEREGWSQERRVAYILDQAKMRAVAPAAE